MNKKQVISQLNQLKKLRPEAEFSGRLKDYLMAHCQAYKPVKNSELIRTRFVFSPIFARNGAIVLGSVLMMFLGWQLLFVPLVLNRIPNSLEVASIQSEWQKADISPYLEEIFNSEVALKDVDSALVQLARYDVAVSNQEVIQQEAQSINIDNALPILEANEVDAMLEQLTQ